MVTRTDIARIAGVSPSTVSYVLSGKRSISAETKTRVLAAIESTGYIPNSRASLLASQSLRLVGVHLDLSKHGVDSVSAEYLKGMHDQAHETGLNLVIPFVDSSPEVFRNFVLSKSVDALVLMEALREDYREDILLELNTPAVILGSTSHADGLPFVETDFESMGKQAVEYVTGLGHKRALVVLRQEDRGDFERMNADILQGIRRQAPISGLELCVLFLPSHVSLAPRVVDELVSDWKPTVVISENYTLLSGLVEVARDSANLELGRDYSVLSLGGTTSFGTESGDQFSEISTDHEKMGATCIDLISQVFYNKARDAKTSKYFYPRLIDRGTVTTPKD